MASVTSNGDEVAAWLAAVVAGFNFTLVGEDQSFGRDIARVAAQGMIDRAVAQRKTPDLVDYTENEPKYRAWKKKKYGIDQPNYRTGQMLDLASMMGETVVEADLVEMTYGLGAVPTKSTTGYISDSDKAVTDKQKAGWAVDAGRPFYALGNTVDDMVNARIDAELAKYIAAQMA